MCYSFQLLQMGKESLWSLRISPMQTGVQQKLSLQSSRQTSSMNSQESATQIQRHLHSPSTFVLRIKRSMSSITGVIMFRTSCLSVVHQIGYWAALKSLPYQLSKDFRGPQKAILIKKDFRCCQYQQHC